MNLYELVRAVESATDSTEFYALQLLQTGRPSEDYLPVRAVVAQGLQLRSPKASRHQWSFWTAWTKMPAWALPEEHRLPPVFLVLARPRARDWAAVLVGWGDEHIPSTLLDRLRRRLALAFGRPAVTAALDRDMVPATFFPAQLQADGSYKPSHLFEANPLLLRPPLLELREPPLPPWKQHPVEGL